MVKAFTAPILVVITLAGCQGLPQQTIPAPKTQTQQSDIVFMGRYASAGMNYKTLDYYDDAVKAGCTDKYFHTIGRDSVLIQCFTGKHEDNVPPYWVK